MDLRNYEHLLNTKCIKMKFNVSFTLILVNVKFHLHYHLSTNILSVVTVYCSNLWKQPWICITYYTSIREVKRNKIKSDGRGWPTSSSGHHSKSTKQILHSKGDQHMISWFNIPLTCVTGKMGWPHDLTRQVNSYPEPLEPSPPHTHTHTHTLYFCFRRCYVIKKKNSFLFY
jgi:hypothetical protein